MKRYLFLLMLMLLLVLSVVVGCAEAEKPISVSELLELGEKYLLELNYEQALVQFLNVIEIEPLNPRGYTGAAEAYIGLGDTEKAIEVLLKGLEMLPGNAEIESKLSELDAPDIYGIDTSDADKLLKELYLLFEEGNFDTAQEFFFNNYAVFNNLPYDTHLQYLPNGEIGKGVSFWGGGFGNDCTANLYYGDFYNSVREGFGVVLSTIRLHKEQYYDDTKFEGYWVGGIPHGKGHEEWSYFNSGDYPAGVNNYIFEGMVSNGFWDGTVYSYGNYPWREHDRQEFEAQSVLKEGILLSRKDSRFEDDYFNEYEREVLFVPHCARDLLNEHETYDNLQSFF